MFAEVTFTGIDPATIKLIITVAAVILPLLFPQMKQPIANILQALLDAFSDLPTIVKSTKGPSDAQTLRASKLLKRRATCPAHAKAIDEVAATALFADAPKVTEQPK
jgi:hypothetical protein